MHVETHDQFDPELDLKFERLVKVTAKHLWMGWTDPEVLKTWFCPPPWKTIECEINLVPGGIFRTVMQGPDGETTENTGCFLEIVKNRRLTWTWMLGPGYRPKDTSEAPFAFTATISFEKVPGGTKYTGHVRHTTPEGRKRHDAMGFQQGWGVTLDQLLALAPLKR
ncbi:SRPBCC family protein [Schlesneria sp. T3-172]|uniref:SRPBCC family protein n=1 Tax=Schlesneria sphaerica TaxID=3373610 RepID=UPI0037CC90C3